MEQQDAGWSLVCTWGSWGSLKRWGLSTSYTILRVDVQAPSVCLKPTSHLGRWKSHRLWNQMTLIRPLMSSVT